MASSTPHPFILLPLFLAFLSLSNADQATTCYTSIFSFGDSLADTGNFLNYTNWGPESRLPYGETYFHHPTGRFSDGRLIIDFIAQAIGVPLLPPYLAGSGDHGFRRGANFAVGGATALENDYFRARGLTVNWTDYSLGTQIEWFKQLLPSLCSSDGDSDPWVICFGLFLLFPETSSECQGLLSSSLFFVGEIGGNDYNEPFMQGRTVDEIRTFVPDVISVISSTLKALIGLGAKTLVVPGNFPIGCIPLYLAHFQSPAAGYYDPQTGCIQWLNEFSEYHNGLLLDELDKLRQLYPNVTIIYADYYKALLSIYLSPREFGFEKPFDACCGGDGSHNCSIQCGDPGFTVCSDTSKYVSWDGMHLTEAAYRAIARGLLQGSYATPSMNRACPHLARYAANLRYDSGRPPVQTYRAVL